MLINLLAASWLLSFLTPVYSLNERMLAAFTDLEICRVNGTYALGEQCNGEESATILELLNGTIIFHDDEGTTQKTPTSPSASPSPSKSDDGGAQNQENNPPSSTSSSTKSPTSPTKSSTISPAQSSSTSNSSPTASSSKSSSTANSSPTANPPAATLPPIIGNAPSPKSGSFTLTKMYQGNDFINEWDFFNNSDPTHGLVRYIQKEDAISLGLVTVEGNVTTIKVDDTTQLQSGGLRNSVRISSQIPVTGGLIIANITAMPTGCSVWPAFWMVGDNWPSNGELDIIEGVNLQNANQMTLHTLPGCTRDDQASPAPGQNVAFTGSPLQASCDVKVNSNSGCGVLSTQKNTFGSGFNANGGGVYAASWDTDGLKIWVFPNGTIPQDIIAMNPTPGSWPPPDAFWSSSTCPVDRYFANMKLTFDTTLCGDFAGTLFPSSGCPGTCADTVADPENFKDAKWIINYVALYT